MRDLEDQLDGLVTMKSKQLPTDEEFMTRKGKLNAEIIVARLNVTDAETSQFDIENVLNYALTQISNLPKLWTELSPELKRRFQKAVFPVGIPYNRGIGFGTR